MTTEAGLVWLADSPVAETWAGFCLTLVKGITEDDVFAAFGADPGQARPRNWRDLEHGVYVQVGRAGDWLFTLEVTSGYGMRPEVLQQLSAGGQAAAARYPSYGFHHAGSGRRTDCEFGYALDGDLIACLSSRCRHWDGRASVLFQLPVSETAVTRPRPPDPSHLQSVLMMAEQVSDASLDPAVLDQAWPAAEIPPLPLEAEGNFCVTFTRETTEHEAFAVFDADLNDIRPRRRREIEHGGFVQVGQAGDWRFALEPEPQHERILRGGSLEAMLRRASAGGEAAAVSVWDYNEHRIAEFGYAADGELRAALTTKAPHRWKGSHPDPFREMAVELGLSDLPPLDPDGLRLVLDVAEAVLGVSMETVNGNQPLPAAPVLPSLDAWGLTRDRERLYHQTTPDIHLLLADGDEEELAAVLAVRVRRELPLSGLEAVDGMTDLVEAGLAGQRPELDPGSEAGLFLRRVCWEAHQTSIYRGILPHQGWPPQPGEQWPAARFSRAAAVVLKTLDYRVRQALETDISDVPPGEDRAAWQNQARADLAGVRRPPGYDKEVRRWRNGYR